MENISNDIIVKKGFAVAYTRVSGKDQKEYGISLSSQQEKCEEAIAKSPYNFLKTIVDGGLSAGTLNRKGIREIIELIEKENPNWMDLYDSL